MALGSYPAIGPKAARLARDEAKAKKSEGVDPVQSRQIAKLKESAQSADTFKETALEWFEKHHSRWSSHYAIREKRNLEKDLFPYFAARRIGEIEPIELLAAIRKVEERGALDVAHRVLTTARAVWRYGVATARAPRDITGDIAGALTPHHGKHFAAITDPIKLGELIRIIRAYQGGAIVRAALATCPMLFQRPGELRGVMAHGLNLIWRRGLVDGENREGVIEGKKNGIPRGPAPSGAC